MPVVSGTQYATTADLAALGLVGAALSSVPTPTQDAALVAASAIADSYLQSRYTLPLTAWGKDLARVVCIIAAYDLITARGFNPMAQNADQNIRQRYLDSLSWLDAVSKGAMTPSQVVDSSTGTSSGGSSDDGSVTTATDGGFQMVTSTVRGWTPRGGRQTDNGGW